MQITGVSYRTVRVERRVRTAPPTSVRRKKKKLSETPRRRRRRNLKARERLASRVRSRFVSPSCEVLRRRDGLNRATRAGSRRQNAFFFFLSLPLSSERKI